MRKSVISHPPKERFAELRAGYQAITGDDCAAMLLAVFEHWTNYKIGASEQAAIANAAERREGLPAAHDEGLWVYKGAEDLEQELLGHYKRKKVLEALSLLIRLDFLWKRRNPKLTWDNIPQYLLRTDVVQAELSRWAASPEDFQRRTAREADPDEESSATPIQSSRQSQKGLPSESKRTDVSPKKDGASPKKDRPPSEKGLTLPQDTPQDTTQDTSIAADAARPGAGVDARIRLPGETLQEHMDRIRAKVRERASVPPAPPAAPPPAPAPAAKKGSKKSRPKAEPKERARNPMFDAVAPHVAGSSDPVAIKADAGQIARVAKYLGDLGITPEQVPLLAEYIQVNCYVTRQPTILAGSWEKFTGRWISAGKGGAKTLADRLMERYEQPKPEVADDPDDDFDYSDGGNLLL